VIVAHHLSPISIVLELMLVVGLIIGFGSLWLRERRRRLRKAGSARMRDIDER
jgi:hypothetical protein